MEVDTNVDINLEDSTQENGFMLFFKSLPEKLSSTIRFFDRNDYWTVHGSDAVFLADEIFKTITAIKHFRSGNKSLEYVIVKRGSFESIIKNLLLVRHYRIEVFKAKNLKSHDWTLAYKASPGNLSQFEDLLFGSNEVSASVGLMAVKSGKVQNQNIIGISYCDVASQKILLCQIIDDERRGNVESVVVQLRPSECLVEGEGSEFRGMLQRNGVAVTDRKKSDFDSKDIVQDMNRLLKTPKNSQNFNFSVLPEANLNVALCSLSASIKYLELLADDTNFNNFTIETFQVGNYVKLDGAASRALNLLSSPTDGLGSNKSLYSLLNRCRTNIGQKLLSSWIHQPLVDPNQIEDRLDILQRLVDDSELRACLHEDLLRRTPDLQMAARKLRSKKAGLQECYKVYRVVSVLPRFAEVLGLGRVQCGDGEEEGKDRDGESGGDRRCAKWKELFVDPLKELIEDFSKFKEMVETTLDLSKVDDNEFLVKPDFDETLQNLSEQMDDLEDKMKKEFNKAARDLSLDPNKTIKLETTSQLGYFFRITRKEEKCLRGNERTYHTIDTNKAGVRFRSSALESLNDKYLTTKEEFLEQQKGVVMEIVSVACGYVEPIDGLIELIAKIDVFVSLAVACLDSPAPYVRPTIIRDGSRRIKLLGARHPCLERQDGVTFIPNDVIMSQDDCKFYIVTGPNMGGKSTYIRSAAMIVLMAQMGCFVPCDLCELTLIDGVMTRVGAGDNQLKGVSTFMAEMLETVNILQTATENSLVIVDELGRGTSTYDGFGLAWSIAKYIATELKSYCLFATHFHELTSLSDLVPSVDNLHVTAITSQDKLTLLYKVEKGVCDQSFGIHVAELVQFPRHVVENARQLANEMERSTRVLVKNNKINDDKSTKIIDSDEAIENKEETFLSRITLEEAEDFLSKAKQLSAICQDDETLWAKIQDLKKTMVENCCS